jgi:hypothetical protein
MLLEGLERVRMENADTGNAGGSVGKRNPLVLPYDSARVDMGAVAEQFSRIDIVVGQLESSLRASRSVKLNKQTVFHSHKECVDHDH